MIILVILIMMKGLVLEYTTISVGVETKARLGRYVSRKGETWDELLNRVLDIVDDAERV